MRQWQVTAASILLLSGCIEFETKNPLEGGKIPGLGDILGDGGFPFPAEGADGGVPGNPGAGQPDEALQGASLGQECSDELACREGLVCVDDTCQFEGETEPGEFCVVSGECFEGQCVSNECVEAGDSALGEPCRTGADCAPGLRCGIVGFSAQCIADGELGLNAECDSSNECASGLSCFQGKCAAIPGSPPAIPTIWEGVECDAPDKEKVRAYFEIPDAPDADEGDYFRLPFPNDILTDGDGRVDVSGFPTPGVNPLVGIDPIEPYVDAVNGMEGWGTDGTLTFRFSGEIDFESFDENGAISWVDITDPEKPRSAAINYRAFSANTGYVCHNVFSVRRGAGAPMVSGRTYAVWLGTAGRSKSGLPIERSENFLAMLGDEPSNRVLKNAWQKYAPFRAYLEAEKIASDDVMVASVITVGPTRDLMSELAGAVNGEEVPTAKDWVKCDSDVDSPCPQAEGKRGCQKSNDAYDEYHALVKLPVFQQGDAPYVEEGGKVRPRKERSEDVCMSLTMPKGAEMPADGWPLVVYAHGTGGSFRGHIRDNVAGALTAAATPTGMVNFAVLGYDQVQHGPRRGESDESPDNLFFNFLNPDAAQGNPLQGGADVISMGRFAASLDTEVDGDEIKIDPTRIVYFGHSQGSMHGSLGLPYSSDYQGAVLSGNGASLMRALLTKTEPVDISSAVPLVVNDGVKLDLVNQTVTGSLPGGLHHPVLTLIQQYIDPADPLNFAKQIARTPVGELPPKNIFQTYGLNDSFSPPETMRVYALAADFSVVQAHASADNKDDLGAESADFPLTATFGVDGAEYTAAVRQYGPPDNRDGHFVAFDVAAANDDATRFLGMAASGVTPQVGE